MGEGETTSGVQITAQALRATRMECPTRSCSLRSLRLNIPWLATIVGGMDTGADMEVRAKQPTAPTPPARGMITVTSQMASRLI